MSHAVQRLMIGHRKNAWLTLLTTCGLHPNRPQSLRGSQPLVGYLFTLIHRTSNMCSLALYRPPSHPLHPSPLLTCMNIHDTSGISAQNQTWVKNKTEWERVGLCGHPVTLPVPRRNRLRGHFVLLHCLSEQNPLHAGSPLVSAWRALISKNR